MKKFKLSLLAILLSAMAFSQSLIVTPEGFQDSKDNTKEYVVIDVEGKTAKELYNNAINYIQRTYKSPDDVIKGTVENEYLSFDTYSKSIGKMATGFSWKDLEATYTIRLDFKDGKAKFELLNLKMFTNIAGEKIPVALKMNSSSGWGIYRKNGKIYMKKMEVTKQDIEDYFNSFIQELKVGLSNAGKSEEW